MLSASAQGSGSEKSGGPGCLLWRVPAHLSDHLPAPGIPDIPDQGPDLLLLHYRGFHVMSVIANWLDAWAERRLKCHPVWQLGVMVESRLAEELESAYEERDMPETVDIYVSPFGDVRLNTHKDED